MSISRLPRSRLVLVGLGLLLLVAVIWQSDLLVARSRTPGALTEPKVAGPARVRAEGRVVCYPGSQVEVGSELAGLILRLPIEENRLVEKDAVIAELKADELRAALTEAQARVRELEAEAALAESDMKRQRELLTTGAVSRQEYERTSRDLAVTAARRASAEATVARLEATLAKTRILAPIKGVVLRRSVEPGETILANTRLATIADLSRTRVEAEVDEYDAGQVKPGQSVRITAEGFPGQAWCGQVEEVPDVVVDKALQPRDPTRPIDVRVLLVKIALSAPTPLKLGQRVEVEIRP